MLNDNLPRYVCLTKCSNWIRWFPLPTRAHNYCFLFMPNNESIHPSAFQLLISCRCCAIIHFDAIAAARLISAYTYAALSAHAANIHPTHSRRDLSRSRSTAVVPKPKQYGEKIRCTVLPPPPHKIWFEFFLLNCLPFILKNNTLYPNINLSTFCFLLIHLFYLYHFSHLCSHINSSLYFRLHLIHKSPFELNTCVMQQTALFMYHYIPLQNKFWLFAVLREHHQNSSNAQNRSLITPNITSRRVFLGQGSIESRHQTANRLHRSTSRDCLKHAAEDKCSRIGILNAAPSTNDQLDSSRHSLPIQQMGVALLFL